MGVLFLQVMDPEKQAGAQHSQSPIAAEGKAVMVKA